MMTDRLRLRCIWPDRWLETRLELPAGMTLAEAKRAALESMLKTRDFDPESYYVELRERRVADESPTLGDLGLGDGSVLTIRAHDLHHPAPFRG